MPEPTGEEDSDSDDEEEDAYMRLSKNDIQILMTRLRGAGEENLGMAMVYALVMQLKESLTELLIAKQASRDIEDQVEQMKIQDVGAQYDFDSLYEYLAV